MANHSNSKLKKELTFAPYLGPMKSDIEVTDF